MIKKGIISVAVLSLILTGCSGTKQANQITTDSIEKNVQTTTSQGIRSEIKANIDKLKDYNIVNIEHMTKGIEQPQEFEPEFPKEFNAGMFKVTFQKLQQNKDNGTLSDSVFVICQTEAKVGHLHKVIPGETVVDGYIYYTIGPVDLNKIDNKMKFTKEEEKYFIEQLYGRFAKKMTKSQADALNQTKDFALAIYFNGNKGIQQFHQEQKDILKKKS